MNRSTTATWRFKRLMATVALGAALGLSLVACGDDGDSGRMPSDDESSSAAAPIGDDLVGAAAPAFTNDKCAAAARPAPTRSTWAASCR